MDLSHILQELQIGRTPKVEEPPGEPGIPASQPPVAEVLARLQESLQTLGLGPEQTSALLSTMEQVFREADPHWLFSDCCSNHGTDLRRAYAELLSCLERHAALPLCEADSGSLPPSSYQTVPARATAVCTLLSALLERLGSQGETQAGFPCSCSGSAPWVSLLPQLAPRCCVLAVTHLQEAAWSSRGSRSAASSLLRSLLLAGNWETPVQLLEGTTADPSPDHQPGILGAVLDLLQPQLKKESWKRNEALKYVFSWALLQLRGGYASDHLTRLFPAALLMSDDYDSNNKLLGVRCLHHLVLNVPAAELRQYNRAEVLYQALFNHLYTPEAELIQVVLPCLLDLLRVLERSPLLSGAPRTPNRYDTVLSLVLTHMEVENKLALRRVYANSLPLFIDRMGVVMIRHLKRLERVVTGYLEICDGPEEQSRLSILEALEKTILVAWPRLQCRVCVLVRSLLRLLVDVSSDRESLPAAVRQELMDRASRCLALLDHATHGKVKSLLQDVDASCTSTAVLACLETVTMASR